MSDRSGIIKQLKGIIPDLSDNTYEQLLQSVEWKVESAVDEYFSNESLYQKQPDTLKSVSAVPSNASKQMIVAYPFASTKVGEITVQKGEVVMIHNNFANGWALVERVVDAGKYGTVPYAFLLPSDAPPQPSSSLSSSLSPSTSSSPSSSPSSLPLSSSSSLTPAESSGSLFSLLNYTPSSINPGYIFNPCCLNVFGANGLDLITNGKEGGFSCLVVRKEFIAGVIKSEIQFTPEDGDSHDIGVVAKRAAESFFGGVRNDSRDCCYIRHYYGAGNTLCMRSSSVQKECDFAGERFRKQETTMGVEIDMTKRTVCFFVNKVKMPHAIDHVPQTFLNIMIQSNVGFRVLSCQKLSAPTPSPVEPAFYAWA